MEYEIVDVKKQSRKIVTRSWKREGWERCASKGTQFQLDWKDAV